MADNFSFDIVSEVNFQEVDNAVNQAQKELSQRFDFKGSKSSIDYKKDEYQLHFHVYGKNGIMGPMEPHPDSSHELAILIEAIGKTQEDADRICSITRSTLLHYGYKNRISTAGNLAFPFSPSDIAMGDVFVFSLYHLMEGDSSALFPLKIKTLGGKKK